MEWLIGIAIVAGTIWLFRKNFGGEQPRSSAPVGPRQPPSPGRPRHRPASYATILHDGRYIPASAEDVDSVFAPAKDELTKCRKAARRLTKSAERAFETGTIKPETIAEAEAALARAQGAAELADSVFDRVFFERESATERWLGFIEKIHDVEAEIEDALMQLRDVRDNPQDHG